MNIKAFNRAGFTLIELLVVIAIIGMIIAMLLPAVGTVREMSRSIKCRNNLKQLAIAVLNYEKNYQILPPACTPSGTVPNKKQNVAPMTYNNQRENWVIHILPYIEEEPLFVEISAYLKGNTQSIGEINSTITGQTPMATLRARELNALLCPSDRTNRTLFLDESGNTWGRGNYAANMGTGKADDLSNINWWAKPNAKGVMGPRMSVRISDIKDGSSNTILIGEIRAGINASDPRGTWALGGAGSSATAKNGFLGGEAYGPNFVDPSSNKGDTVFNCVQGKLGVAAQERTRIGMPCTDGSAANIQATNRSMHSGGINVVFADGNARFISNAVPKGTVLNTTDYNALDKFSQLGVWDRLVLSSDGQTIDGDSLQ